ncbi:hypothetical protein [Sphingobacterium spiritivorum]|uniref:hypothetical protein n=1 Tax=Sphingobacterium spiritivorum TaxID=258 RepID=UPI00191A68BD|nr:hypothetical protein [Sphingobacterium spiritivorum]QQT27641.1 hypothetical protein I6J02_07300 [Sphingobacterium spiritivorum]
MKRKHNGMRPQDIVVLVKISTIHYENWQLKDLANSLYISNSEISESLERSAYAGLIDFGKRNVHRGNLLNFLIHGMKYVFPAQAGILTRGVPTAHSHPFMQSFISSEQSYVWPSSSGSVLGQAIEPFYANQVKAIAEDEELYRLLALLDVIRVGKLREKAVAEKELKEELSANVKSY